MPTLFTTATSTAILVQPLTSSWNRAAGYRVRFALESGGVGETTDGIAVGPPTRLLQQSRAAAMTTQRSLDDQPSSLSSPTQIRAAAFTRARQNRGVKNDTNVIH
jgi:hypothetical protein